MSDVRRRCDAMECTWLHLDGAPAPGRDGLPARTGVQDPHVTDLLRRLQADALAGMPLGTACVQALALTPASDLRGRCGNGAGHERQAAPASGPRLLGQWERLRLYIGQHIGQPISVAEMACTAGYSTHHFARRFRQTFQKSPSGTHAGRIPRGRACNARAAPLAGDARSRRRPRFRQRWLSRRTAQSPRLCTACTKKISTTTTASMMSGRNRW
ncbi:helix-turn-helix transcriptional regulator [Acidovorax cattleyae]|nr:helix-turn-helix transcriptional regulator [Paracidovorax cattleyae]